MNLSYLLRSGVFVVILASSAFADSWTTGTGFIYSGATSTKIGIGLATTSASTYLFDVNGNSNFRGTLFTKGGVGVGRTSVASGNLLDVNGGAYIRGRETLEAPNASGTQNGIYFRSSFGTPGATEFVLNRYNTGYAYTDIAGGNNVFPRTVLESNQEHLFIGTRTAHSLNLATSDQVRMLVSSGGNVGINQINPASKLDVNGSILARGVNAPTTGVGVEIDYGGIAGTGRVIAYDRVAGSYKPLRLGNGFDILANGDINGIGAANFAGRLAVGMTGPLYDIDVKTNGAVNIRGAGGRLYANNLRPNTGTQVFMGPESPILPPAVPFRFMVDGWVSVGGQAALGYNATTNNIQVGDLMGGDSKANLVFRTQDTDWMWINGSGNIGIGSSNPDAMLHILGNSSRTMPLHVSAPGNRSIGKLDGGPSMDLPTLRDRFGLPTTNGNSASLSFLTSDWDNANGIGLITGDNVASPIVWMYDYGGRNAFTVAKKGYAGTGDDATAIGSKLTPLFQVRENGNVGIGTVSPNAKLDVNGDANINGNLAVNSIKTHVWSIAPDYVFDKDYKLASLNHVESYVNEHKHLPEIPSAKEIKDKGIDLAEMNMKLLRKVEELTLYSIEQHKEIESLKRDMRKIKGMRK